jgi:hypothetical protein
MRKMNKILFIVLFLLCIPVASKAGPVLPARIGGSVTVNGIKLTRAASEGYVFKATRKDGKGFSPAAEDKNSLNKSGKYIIDIPIYDPAGQPEGAQPKSKAIIHVYKNGVELKIIKPSRGEIAVGKGGTITPVDLVILNTDADSAKEKHKK